MSMPLYIIRWWWNKQAGKVVIVAEKISANNILRTYTLGIAVEFIMLALLIVGGTTLLTFILR